MTIKQLYHRLKRISWYKYHRDLFLKNPNRLLAFKGTLVIGTLVISMVVLGLPFYGVTLGLGALAGVLSETEDHPKGRLKSMALKTISFAISSFSVELLQPYPILLGLGLSFSTVVFILLGGIGERYRGVTFGALLIGVYTMIGAQISPNWYIQPILLTLGAFIYGAFSYVVLLLKPYSLLNEQLARGFYALSDYFDKKAGLFPSDAQTENEIRTDLALLNIQIVESLDTCKEVLNSYGEAQKNQRQLQPYLHYFMVLQGLHERATSSHERYDLLTANPANGELIGGIRQLLHELAFATKNFAESLLTGDPYKHPMALGWLVDTINGFLQANKQKGSLPLRLLIANITQCHETLEHIDEIHDMESLPKLEKDSRTYFERLRSQLHINHPRLRHALRLSVSFLIGFAVYEYFNIEKGEWIVLTILFVLQPSFSETRKRLLERTIGTLMGVVIGVSIIRLFSFSGQILLLITSAYLFLIWMKRRYSVGVVFITIFVLCAFNIISNKGVEVMAPRLIDTLIGAFISFIVVRFLWPEWQYKKLPGLLSEVINKNTAYFKVILDEYQNPTTDDLKYRIARREAHRADNALVKVWQNMQFDPQKQQQLNKTAFTLTYLNHALLSYLSALGAHRTDNKDETLQILVHENDILNTLEDAFNWLTAQNDSVLEPIEKKLNAISTQLLSTNKYTTQMQYVLLYNITLVTLQILEQARLFRLTSPMGKS
ncbi:YccS family putative transporter [Maribacter polysaccharolyticus]|uniref:YccS family putative transporter n=1 Tax=Maribacter polysaccharolyticus TaxID=3020831 RepID=UPI00237F34A1|nr:YccS family putative transporter [Maribacter polysaccharolyticus]MDE3740696.1 YccS family putative transporter [Maribacter polysaccharolyticus]